MTQPEIQIDPLALGGLEPAPAQVWGGVRLVPLIRRRPATDLRISPRAYGATGLTAVDLGGRPATGARYFSYIPYGLVVDWTADGAEVAIDTRISAPDGRGIGRSGQAACNHPLFRMVRREERGPQSRLRMLPQHLALEGYLSLCFGGPDVAWPAYSEHVLRRGLSPRVEWAVSGRGLIGVDDALRIFEIHAGQCGLLIFVGETLAGATVVSHPDDYRRLHHTLIDDVYGGFLVWHARYAAPATVTRLRLDGAGVGDLEALAAELARARATWADFDLRRAAGAIGRPVIARRSYRMGPFTLARFTTGYDDPRGDHLGEAIVRDDGELLYLKTYRLDRAQQRRGRLLTALAAHRWDLGRAAAALGFDRAGLEAELERAELGFMLARR